MWSISADNRGNLQKSCRTAPSPRFPGLGTWCIIPHRSRSLMRSTSWRNQHRWKLSASPLTGLLRADAAQLMRVINRLSTSATLARSFTMAGDHELLSSAAQGTTLTVMARIGFGARGLVYLLVAAFATAAALDFGQQPHGIIDAVQAVANSQLQVILAGGIGAGLACLAAYFALRGVWQCCRGRGFR